MRIALDIEPEQAGMVLEALADYAERVRFEAESSSLGSTGPNPTLSFLARAIGQTERVIFEQLEPYADAIPAVGRRLDEPIRYQLEGAQS